MNTPEPLVRSLCRDHAGNISVLTAFCITALAGFVGLATDVGLWYAQKVETQAATDAAVLAAAAALTKTGHTDATVRAAALNGAAINGFKNGQGATVDVALSASQSSVTVTITKPAATYFSRLAVQTPPQIRGRAIASLSTPAGGAGAACVLVLHPTAGPAMDVQNGSITAPDCDIHVHSTAANAVDGKPNGEVTANRTCIAGGYGSKPSYAPPPETRCDPIEDPLANTLPTPAGVNGPCLSGTGSALQPGRYCNGLGGGTVTLAPGTYIVSGGTVSGNISGDGVTIYLTGTALLNFGGNARLDISAPTSGPYAGISIFQDPDVALGQTHRVHGGPDLVIEGTVYMPKAHLRMNGHGTAASPSPWSIFIVRSMDWDGQPGLTVNADYASSRVPRPKPLAPMVRLTE